MALPSVLLKAVGTFMPNLPVKNFLDAEMILPDASSRSFWLKGSAWQIPDYDNVELFIDKLVREEVLAQDPVVEAVLHETRQAIPSRTIRHRFLHTTGMTQSQIRQLARAQRAAALLREGVSILDTVFEVGYYDQPHLTRSLKHFIGQTPKQWIEQPSTEIILLSAPE